LSALVVSGFGGRNGDRCDDVCPNRSSSDWIKSRDWFPDATKLKFPLVSNSFRCVTVGDRGSAVQQFRSISQLSKILVAERYTLNVERLANAISRRHRRICGDHVTPPIP
jgi:hypothetical protein